jgi:hypothetical protein
MNRAVSWLLVIGALILAAAIVVRALVEVATAAEPVPPDPRLAEVTRERDQARAERTRYRRGYLRQRRQRRAERRAFGRALQARAVGSHPDEQAFLCIHQHEGRWDDPAAPYWGGLQMDRSFQRSYGARFYRHYGTADRWPQSVQMAVAILARISGRGYYPWPNTARACGLLP